MNNNNNNPNQFCRRTRREFFWDAGGAFTGLALTGLLGKEGFFAKQAVAADGVTAFDASGNPLAGKPSMHIASAKRVIFLFMFGGPSHVDTFDYKPDLYKFNEKTIDVKTFGRGGKKTQGRVIGPKWDFKQQGQSGQWVSGLFPHISKCVDDIAFVKSMYADSPLHGSALLMMNSGRILSGAPSLGSWVNYGLGSVNENLPGFVVMLDQTGGPISGAKNWSSGFMPATYQGTVLRSKGSPILDLSPQKEMHDGMQQKMLETLSAYNHEHQALHPANSELSARINSFELAYKMQSHAPEAIEIESEPDHIKSLYGIDDEKTRDFGQKCLRARRLAERGVRFIQIYSGGNHSDHNWDAHTDIAKNHNKHAAATDKPIAGLLKDLKQRGMLDDTLVVWGGEFGRQPTAEYAVGTGRDHNAYAFTMWLAGGGIKGGQSIGQTDNLGAQGVGERYHVNRLHATILHQLGLDPNHLSYFFNGLDQRLVGVEGADIIPQLIT